MIIDAHVHASPSWYEPIETVLGQLERHGVGCAVLTAMLGQYDNSYLFTSAAQFAGSFVVVAGVDSGCDDPYQRLAALAQQGAAGVRLRATDRSPAADPLAVWRAAAQLRLPVSVVGRWPELTAPAFDELLTALPELVVVLEHLGGGPTPDATDADRSGRLAVFDLARFPSVHIKIAGLGEFARRGRPGSHDPFERPVPDYLATVHAKFGAGRMMWGSDFPPVAAREGYGNALSWCRAELSGLADEDAALVFGGTAARVFGIDTQAEIR